MIYVTSDLHGDLDRLKTAAVKKLRRHDTLIVLGDFGFIWEDSKKEKKLLKKLGKRKFQILFLEGTHDNYELLKQYPQELFCGGEARLISGKLRQLCRGGVFEIEGKKLFCFGGGVSRDREERAELGTWWQGEMATEAEKAAALANLAKNDFKVDYICTHEGPARLVQFLDMDLPEADGTELFLDEIAEKTEYTRWLFGALHLDKQMGPKAAAVYRQVLSLK